MVGGYEPFNWVREESDSENVEADKPATEGLEKDDVNDTRAVFEASAEVVQELKREVKMNLGLGRLEE